MSEKRLVGNLDGVEGALIGAALDEVGIGMHVGVLELSSTAFSSTHESTANITVRKKTGVG